jgi:hypothetical protein
LVAGNGAAKRKETVLTSGHCSMIAGILASDVTIPTKAASDANGLAGGCGQAQEPLEGR